MLRVYCVVPLEPLVVGKKMRKKEMDIYSSILNVLTQREHSIGMPLQRFVQFFCQTYDYFPCLKISHKCYAYLSCFSITYKCQNENAFEIP